MPIVTPRESANHTDILTDQRAPRAVKERILSKLGIKDEEPQAPSLTLQSPSEPTTNMIAPRSETQIPAVASEAVPEADPAIDTQAAPSIEEPLSPRMAALARREREITRRMQQFAAEKKSWEEQKATTTPPRDIDTGKFISREELDRDLIGTLTKAGYDYDKITERMLNPGHSPTEREIAELKAQIAELKGGQTKVQEEFQNRNKLEYDTAVAQIRRDVSATVANSADYTTIKESGSTEAVVRLIEKTFEDTGDMLSIEEAAAQVEDYLIEEAIKVANYTKVRARNSQPPTEALPRITGDQKLSTQQLQQRPNSTIQLKTLTNATGTTTQKARSDAERRARAIAAARGEKL